MSTPTRTCPSCNTPLPGVAAFCYVCGTATPPGFDMRTGERVAVTRSGVTAVELRKLLQRALGPGYELGARVGAGGFAEVFRAQDLRLKRSVAVKVLRPDLGLSPGMLERFQREAETIAALRHPNIVPIFDVGEAHGVAYLIMPFIEGESLRARMERDGKLPVPEVRRILREAAHGLAAAHDAGVIHRDVKPENIMLEGRDARILLMDFGIAKAVGGDEETPVTEEGIAPALTSTGIIVGTPQYMSPEQACGDKTIDARTDQYSLGVVGYRLLSGGLPFEGESTRAVLYKQLVSEPPPIMEKVPDAPPGLASAITRAMRKEPRERFDTMTEFARMVEDEQLSLTAAGMTAIAAPGGKTAKSPKPAKIKSASASRNRLLMIGGGIAAVALIAVAGITLSGGSVSDAFQPISAIGGLDAPADDSVSGTASNTPATTSTLPQAPVTNTRRPGVPPPPAPTGARGTTGRPATTPGTTSATPPAAPRVTCASLINASDWTAALPLCTTAAEAGEVVAMRHLAGMYDRGDGVPADPAQAFNWYRRASPNDAESKFQLSRMYEIGRGTPRDARANVSTLREAAAMGHLQAILTLATRLENGAGMGRDYNESALWYTKAATAGSTQAMLKLADWARRGRGMTRDEALAVQYFRQAGDAGNADGAWEAARAYLEGRGVAADEATGMTLLRQAARLGNSSAVEELQRRGG
jgi:serine/threonine protein kinase/TPR repeat protein